MAADAIHVRLPDVVASSLAAAKSEITASFLMHREKLLVHDCLDRLGRKLRLAVEKHERQSSANPSSPLPVFPYGMQPNPMMYPVPPPYCHLPHPGMHAPLPVQAPQYEQTAARRSHEVQGTSPTMQGGSQKRTTSVLRLQDEILPKRRQRTGEGEDQQRSVANDLIANSSIVWSEQEVSSDELGATNDREAPSPATPNASNAVEIAATNVTSDVPLSPNRQPAGSTSPETLLHSSSNENAAACRIRDTVTEEEDSRVSSSTSVGSNGKTSKPNNPTCEVSSTTDNANNGNTSMTALPTLRLKYASISEIAEDWYGLGSSAFAPHGGLMGLRAQKHGARLLRDQLGRTSSELVVKMKKVAMCVALHICRLRGTVDHYDQQNGFFLEFLSRKRFPEPETLAAAHDVMAMVRARFPKANSCRALYLKLQEFADFELIFPSAQREPKTTTGTLIVTKATIALPKLRQQYSSILEIAEDWYGFGSSAFAPHNGLLGLQQTYMGGHLFKKKNWSRKQFGQLFHVRAIAACVALQIGRKCATIKPGDERSESLEQQRFPEHDIRTAAQEITKLIEQRYPGTKTLNSLSDRLRSIAFYAPCFTAE